MQKVLIGFLEDDAEDVVTLCELSKDPGGSSLIWFRRTGEKVSLAHYQQLSMAENTHHGRCYDTGEHISHIGELIRSHHHEAPKDATLGIFRTEGNVGTRTFQETVTMDFYSTS